MAIAGAIVLAPQPSLGQEVPAGATNAAKAKFKSEIEMSRTNPERFRRSWDITQVDLDFSAATLADPYVVLGLIDERVSAFAESNDPEILSFARSYHYRFPMLIGETHIGTIEVSHNRDEAGRKAIENAPEWLAGGGRMAGNDVDRRIMELRKQYPVKSGYLVSILKTDFLGHHFLITQRGSTKWITPLNPVGAMVLGVQRGEHRCEYPIIEYEKALPLFGTRPYINYAYARLRVEEGRQELRDGDGDRE
jgi:hypothetical protein